MPDNSPDVSEALNRIEAIDDVEVSTVTFRGFARSRSNSDLHLAISTGVIAIPLQSVVEMTPISTANPVLADGMVSVRVRDAGSVRYIMPMAPRGHQLSIPAADRFNSPLRAGQYPPGDEELPPVYGPGVSTQFCTSTHTDGNACDDCECNDYPDDLAQ